MSVIFVLRGDLFISKLNVSDSMCCSYSRLSCPCHQAVLAEGSNDLWPRVQVTNWLMYQLVGWKPFESTLSK